MSSDCGAPCGERCDGALHGVVHLLATACGAGGRGFPQPLPAEELAGEALRLRHPIAVDDYFVAWQQPGFGDCELGRVDQTHGHARIFERVVGAVGVDDQRRAVGRVDVVQPSRFLQQTVEDGGVLLPAGAIVQVVIEAPDALSQRGGVRGRRGQRALQQRSQQRRADALARDVRFHHRPGIPVDSGHIVVVAAHFLRGDAAAAGAKPSFRRQAAGQQRLLDGLRQAQFLLQLPLGALFLQQPRILEDRGSLDRQRLQEFAIAARHVRGYQARIHVEHAHGLARAVEYLW